MSIAREIDLDVAEKFTGWTPVCNGDFLGNALGSWRENAGWCKECGLELEFKGEHRRLLPHYSTSIADAFKLVYKIEETKGYQISISKVGEGWDVSFWNEEDEVTTASSRLLPLAICLAALKLTEQSEVSA